VSTGSHVYIGGTIRLNCSTAHWW